MIEKVQGRRLNTYRFDRGQLIAMSTMNVATLRSLFREQRADRGQTASYGLLTPAYEWW